MDTFPSLSSFPALRLRRWRQHNWSRCLVRETALRSHDLIWPVFIREGDDTEPQTIESMPEVYRYTIKQLVDAVGEAIELGIPAIALFPRTDPSDKSEDGREAFNRENLVCRALQALRQAYGCDIGLICDVALDPYTTHGHDGLLVNGDVHNDQTVAALCKQARTVAEAGADVVAPSDMMDGRVGAIRRTLDEAGYEQTLILSYAAKYASSFYGPFRDAVGSRSPMGQADKRTYQMDPANTDEALREVGLDLEEGADAVMVKPGMPYLDIVQRVKAGFEVPTFVYQVSGEYAMLCAAAERGWLDRQAVMLESLFGFKRAGADGVLTYFAVEAARALRVM